MSMVTWSQSSSVDSARVSSELADELTSDAAVLEYARNCCIFVEEPMPEEVQTGCSICLQTLQEPYIVECCGNCYCKTCIERIQQTYAPCPLCMAPTFQKMADKHLQQVLNQRKVYCLFIDDGCPWQGEVGSIHNHINVNNNSGHKWSTCQ